MASISEYEQQRFWDESNMGKLFKIALFEAKKELHKALLDQIVFGESYIQVTKEGAKRLDPMNVPQDLKNKLYKNEK